MKLSAKAQAKMRKCKALQGVTVEQLLHKTEFISNLATLLDFQKNLRKKAKQEIMYQTGKSAPAHPVDKFELHTAEQFRDEYMLVLSKRSARPAGERLYIEQLGRQAQNLTVVELLLKEFPELKDDIFPTN